MKKIELEELKQIELEILLKFVKICEENGFTYSLCGGTLLGAVRHKGFIPWDDDIDVCMPRKDYDSLIEFCKNNNTDLKIVSFQTVAGYYDLYAKAINPDTYLVEDVVSGPEEYKSVYIDVFPIDGLGNTKKEAIKNFNLTSFRRELLVASKWTKFFRSKTHSFLIEPIRFIFFCLSRFANKEKLVKDIEKCERSINFEDSDYCGCICGSYRTNEIMPKRIFEDLCDYDFEGHIFKGPKDYDYYLSRFYGDYMQLPPLENRNTHHFFEAFWK